MPGRGSLSSLVVDLEVNSAKLRTGLDQVTKRMDDFGKKIDKIGKVVSAAMAFEFAKDATTKLANFVKRGAEAADQMGDLAQAVGVPVEQLSRLAYAASFSGISTGQLGSALSDLNKRMLDASTGSSKQAAIFSAMGISIRDTNGELRDGTEVFGDIADKFSQMEDGSTKAALAQELFGSAGAKLIPVLNGGRKALSEMGAEADRFGFTVTGAAAASGGALADNIDRLTKLGDGLAISVASDLSPSLSNLTAQLLKTTGETNALKEASKAIATVFRLLVSAGAIVAGLFEVIGKSIAMTAAAAVAVANGEFKRAWQVIKDGSGSIGDTVKATGARIEAMWSTQTSAAGKALDEQERKQKEVAAKVMAALDAQINGRKRHTEAMQREARAAEEALRIAQKFASIDASAMSSALAADQEVARRRQEFANIGATPAAVLQQKTAGFSGFDQALQAFSDRMNEHAGQVAFAEKLREQGDVEGALAAEAAADRIMDLARRAGIAADAFKDSAQQTAEATLAAKRIVADARAGIGNQLMNATGVGGLVQAGVQGAAAGGPMGALAGVVTELLSRSATMGKILDLVGQVAQVVADALGTLIRPLMYMVAAVMPVAEGLAALISPFEMVYEAIFGQFIPILVIVGELLKSLAPVSKIVATAITGVISILMLNFTPVLELLFETLRVAAYGFTKLATMFAPVWNGMIDALKGVLDSISGLEIKIGDYVIKPFAFLGDWSKNLNKSKMSVEDLTAQLQELEGLSWDEARAKAEGIAAQDEQTEAIKEATGALTNVPAAWRIALRRFDSMAPAGGGALTTSAGNFTGQAFTGPHFARGGFVDRPTIAMVGEGGEGEHITPDSKLRRTLTEVITSLGFGGGVPVQLQVFLDGREIHASVKHYERRENFQKSGSLVRGAPRFAGG